jgi:hypothetical protein
MCIRNLVDLLVLELNYLAAPLMRTVAQSDLAPDNWSPEPVPP